MREKDEQIKFNNKTQIQNNPFPSSKIFFPVQSFREMRVGTWEQAIQEIQQIKNHN